MEPRLLGLNHAILVELEGSLLRAKIELWTSDMDFDASRISVVSCLQLLQIMSKNIGCGYATVLNIKHYYLLYLRLVNG